VLLYYKFNRSEKRAVEKYASYLRMLDIK